MTVAIIITAYILNVFLNRWLNKMMVKLDIIDPAPFIWFFSLISTVIMLGFILDELLDRTTWFSGKNW
jgi:hypothetical protein